MKNCLNCGKNLIKKQSKFCSNKCQQEYAEIQYIKKWKNKEETGISGEYQISNYIRNYMLKKANYQCEKCGWNTINPYTNKVPLEIHHKDGNYKNTTENNLEVLCPNCHSLTNNFRARGKGRDSRKITYLINECIDCGIKISKGSIRCKDCEIKRRVNNLILPISKEDLKKRIREESFCSIAKDFNITDNGLRKWMKHYNLPTKKTEINQYSDEEWEKI